MSAVIQILKSIKRRIYCLLGMFGFNPFQFAYLRFLPKFIKHNYQFKSLGGKVDRYYPILSDWGDSAGNAKGHYFWQDLLVAQWIHQHAPSRHLDIASRIDGFVAHVASYRTVDIVDIRQMTVNIPNVNFIQADLMNLQADLLRKFDSVSCLHAIEHFGLGRYGDPIDPDGHEKGLKNIADLVIPGGRLYIAFPVALATRVEFNAHRVFDLRWPLQFLKDEFTLQKFALVDDDGNLSSVNDPEQMTGQLQYGCGIYCFLKRK